MAEERLSKIAMKWMPKQKRARGRPKKNWMEGIKKVMNERNLNEGQWEDRKQWSLGVRQRRKTFWTRYIHYYYYYYVAEFLKIFKANSPFSISYLAGKFFIISWSWVLPEKLTVPQPVKKCPTFYVTRRFITIFIRARHLSLSWARSIQSILRYHISWRCYSIYCVVLTRMTVEHVLLKIHFNTILPSTRNSLEVPYGYHIWICWLTKCTSYVVCR